MIMANTFRKRAGISRAYRSQNRRKGARRVHASNGLGSESRRVCRGALALPSAYGSAVDRRAAVGLARHPILVQDDLIGFGVLAEAARGGGRQLGGPRPAEDGGAPGRKLPRSCALRSLLEAGKKKPNKMAAFVVHDLKSLRSFPCY